MRTEIPMFGIGLQGKSPNVTSSTLINAYFEFHEEKDRTAVSVHGTPGLTQWVDKGDTPWRGLHAFPTNSLLYGVHRGTFYSINNAKVLVNLGTINSTSGRVDICDDGTYITVVDGAEIYTYNTSTPATPIAAVTDADRPTSPNTCAFQGARILTDENGTGQFKGGGNYDPTAWSAIDFATAESNPDDLIRVTNYRGTVTLFGTHTTEFWSNVGGSGFPYTRIMQADIEYGLAARWSVANFMGSYAFLAKNLEGQVTVMMLNGYNPPTRISNFELESLINNYSTVGDAAGFGYMLGGHPMYQLNFSAAGKSWLYDGSTGYWSELRYGATARHRAEIGVDFINQTVVADYENGKLYLLDDDTYTDNGDSIHTILRGRHIYTDKKKVRFTRLELGLEPATALVSGQGSDPVAGLRVSKDGGHSYGTQTFATMGKIGEYKDRCIWRRLGSGRDLVCEVTITEPIKRVITDSTLIVEDGLS